jgi:hypothetical protein
MLFEVSVLPEKFAVEEVFGAVPDPLAAPDPKP